MIGYAVTGSFCMFSKVPEMVRAVMKVDSEIMPIISETVQKTDTRFADAKEFVNALEIQTGNVSVKSIKEAEPIGPKELMDAIVVAPCTGNTLAKLAAGITDSCVLMACKAHLRNGKPVVIFVSTNDGLGSNAENIGKLMNMKNIFFVPFGQDDPMKKAKSLVAHPGLVAETLKNAMKGRQIQPVLRNH